MDPNTIQQQSPQINSTNTSLVSYFLKNKIAMIILVIILILILIIVSINLQKPNQTNTSNNQVTPVPTISIAPTISTNEVSGSPATTQIDPVMEQQIKPQIDQRVTIPYTISAEKTYSDTWAMVEITSQTTDPANVVLKKENGQWVVILGPGTHFSPDELTNVGAPQNLSNEANTTLVP